MLASQQQRQSSRRRIIKQGYLKKLPNVSKVGSSFKRPERRWFVFGIVGDTARPEPYLEYYENEHKVLTSNPINMVLLESCRYIIRSDPTNRHDHMFTLVLQNRHLQLLAPSSLSLYEWCQAIETKLEALGIINTGGNEYISVPRLLADTGRNPASPLPPTPLSNRPVPLPPQNPTPLANHLIHPHDPPPLASHSIPQDPTPISNRAVATLPPEPPPLPPTPPAAESCPLSDRPVPSPPTASELNPLLFRPLPELPLSATSDQACSHVSDLIILNDLAIDTPPTVATTDPIATSTEYSVVNKTQTTTTISKNQSDLLIVDPLPHIPQDSSTDSSSEFSHESSEDSDFEYIFGTLDLRPPTTTAPSISASSSLYIPPSSSSSTTNPPISSPPSANQLCATLIPTSSTTVTGFSPILSPTTLIFTTLPAAPTSTLVPLAAPESPPQSTPSLTSKTKSILIPLPVITPSSNSSDSDFSPTIPSSPNSVLAITTAASQPAASYSSSQSTAIHSEPLRSISSANWQFNSTPICSQSLPAIPSESPTSTSTAPTLLCDNAMQSTDLIVLDDAVKDDEEGEETYEAVWNEQTTEEPEAKDLYSVPRRNPPPRLPPKTGNRSSMLQLETSVVVKPRPPAPAPDTTTSLSAEAGATAAPSSATVTPASPSPTPPRRSPIPPYLTNRRSPVPGSVPSPRSSPVTVALPTYSACAEPTVVFSDPPPSLLPTKMQEAMLGEGAVSGWTNPPLSTQDAPPPYVPRGALECGANQALKASQVQKLQKQMFSSAGVKVVLRRVDCHMTIAFVDCFKHVWVAGWNQRARPFLHNGFHIGDQITSINGQVVDNSTMARKLIKHCSSSDKITFMLRRVPTAKVFAIRREHDGQDLGITRAAGTAEIVYVDPMGLATQHGMPSKAKTFDGDNLCNWWITEVNQRSLNLFFKDNEVEARLNAVGRDISIMVQPSQFIVELKRQLKAMKKMPYKDFLLS